ncbi:hypothetical protein PRZ48_005182 [Zasmidium cellare]|uniref:Uncharacterized protein n=1 Tax=Zasmidium cellare TaxID=395010 RepID=A0ABR0EST8_ZASCE|nr:hypothetical protein PRZ48_005182 [Zasmidium cellare]
MKLLQATLIAATAILAHAQQDTSGNTLAEFDCSSATFPAGVDGDPPPLSSFSSAGSVTIDGQKVTDVNCQRDPKNTDNANLAYCVFSDSRLDGGSVSIHFDFTPAGGECSMDFGYKGTSYSTGGNGEPDTTPSCATSKCGVTPFSCDVSAKCYFNY